LIANQTFRPSLNRVEIVDERVYIRFIRKKHR